MRKSRHYRGATGGALVNLIVLVCLAVLCALVYFVRHPIMRYVAESWVIDEPASHADAILLLSDDNFYADRATRATELFRQGIAPVVVASGRRLRPNAGISELMVHDLVERGVPKDKILAYPQDAESTQAEAQGLAKLCLERGWQTVVVVTSNYHTRRALYIFNKLFPRGVTVSVASARDGDFDPEKWWEKRKSTKLFLRELVGMLDAYWELRSVPESSSHPQEKAKVAAFAPGSRYSSKEHTFWNKSFTCPLHPLSAVIS